MTQNPWKHNHPGIPKDWRQIGEGGNAIVWRDGNLAIKRLKHTVSIESRARFQREVTLMQMLKGRPDLNVVPVIEVRIRASQCEIVMKALDGNLSSVLQRFRCNPSKAATALAPIVETLGKLATQDPRVHHRDLKPSNILYQNSEMNLYLADFGCAFLSDSDRITPDKRALGAWAYRPPEYARGKVDHVDEYGDVFSIGKIFWTMINGSGDTPFPESLWHLPEYDLTTLCRENQKIAEAMYIIAKCCSIRQNRRPTLDQLGIMLENLASETPPSDNELGMNVLVREQEQEIEYAQRQAIARLFVMRLTTDLADAIRSLHRSNPSSLLLQSWVDELDKCANLENDIIEQVAVHESDAPVINVLRRQEIFMTRFIPEGMGGPLRFLISFGKTHNRIQIPTLTIKMHDPMPIAISEGFSTPQENENYTNSTISIFLAKAIRENSTV